MSNPRVRVGQLLVRPILVLLLFTTGTHEQAAGQSAGVQAIQKLSPGAMTITTANTEANIEVRATSTGPAACEDEFCAPSGSIRFMAPPGGYSPWTTLAAHIGKVTLTVNQRALCDAEVLSEVRYFK